MRRSRKKIALLSLGVILGTAAILLSVWRTYVGTYYRALPEALEAVGTEDAQKEQTLIFPADGGQGAGLIFIPGGKVEYTAYAPLLRSLAERGFTCFLLHVRDNLAMLDRNAPDGIIGSHPEISEWYIAGHSLGGAVASMYAARHADEFSGIMLMGAYASSDLSGTGFRALLVYGSEDLVMNRAKFEECRKNLPEESEEHVIQGGNHAGFGTYGAQRGDGEAAISPGRQQQETADVCASFASRGTAP